MAEIELSAALFAEMGGESGALALAEERPPRGGGRRARLLLASADSLAFRRHIAGEGVQRELLMRADALERAAPGHARDDTALECSGSSCTSTATSRRRANCSSPSASARARGYLDHENFALLLLTELEVRAGRWQLGRGLRARTLEPASGTDLWNAEAAGHWARALVDAHLGRVESARAHAETGFRQAAELGDLAFATRCAHVLGFLALSLGDAEDGGPPPRAAAGAEAQLEPREPAIFCIAPDLAEALVLAGDLDAAREVQAELETRGRALGRPGRSPPGSAAAG